VSTRRVTALPRTRYVVVGNGAVEDSALSWAARGLLAYLLSRPKGWEVSAERLASHGTEGRKAVQAALRELESAGYLRRTRVREGGKFKGWDHEVSDVRGHFTSAQEPVSGETTTGPFGTSGASTTGPVPTDGVPPVGEGSSKQDDPSSTEEQDSEEDSLRSSSSEESSSSLAGARDDSSSSSGVAHAREDEGVNDEERTDSGTPAPDLIANPDVDTGVSRGDREWWQSRSDFELVLNAAAMLAEVGLAEQKHQDLARRWAASRPSPLSRAPTVAEILANWHEQEAE